MKREESSDEEHDDEDESAASDEDGGSDEDESEEESNDEEEAVVRSWIEHCVSVLLRVCCTPVARQLQTVFESVDRLDLTPFFFRKENSEKDL